MIFSASYLFPSHHHGLLVGISRKLPDDFRTDHFAGIFAPSYYLLDCWNKKKITQEEYIKIYRKEFKFNLPSIDLWLKNLDPKEDMTLLSYELPGIFSHRNLVMNYLEKHRLDCYGGQDIPLQMSLFELSVDRNYPKIPPAHKTIRERIDWYIERGQNSKKKDGSSYSPFWAYKSIEYDHKKNYFTLTFEDLKYIANQINMIEEWALHKALELDIVVTREEVTFLREGKEND